jgi:serine/threonine-protein kinase
VNEEVAALPDGDPAPAAPPLPFEPIKTRPGLELPGGRYRLDDLIARGGRAETWRATDAQEGRVVAIKTPLAALAGDSEAARMFRAEALAGERVHHPAVVETLDYHEIDSHAFLVLEFAPGRTLAEEVKCRGTMPAREILVALAQVAAGLHAVHRARLVHRDVTPQNIMWNGRAAKLIDFGIAVQFGAPTLTAGIEVPGNPDYLAPELARGANATPAADIYSLALVLLTALTGAKPFTGATAADTALAHVLGPSPVAPVGLASDLRILIHQMTAKDPAARPSNAMVVSRLLEDFAQDPYAYGHHKRVP